MATHPPQNLPLTAMNATSYSRVAPGTSDQNSTRPGATSLLPSESRSAARLLVTPPKYAELLKHRFPGWSPSEVRAATPAGDGSSVGNLPRDWPQVDISELHSQRGEIRLGVSALELLARCPFRFFAARIARLQGLKPLLFSESIEALQRGQLMHLLLEKMLGPYIRQNRSLGEMAQELLKDNSCQLRSAVASASPACAPNPGSAFSHTSTSHTQ